MATKKYIYIVQVTRQLSIDILNNFIKEGAEVELITGVIEPNYEVLNANVKVKLITKYNNQSGFKRLYTWSIFTIRSFFIVLFKSSKNELILVTTPPFIVFLGTFFFRLRKQKYHLIIWDLYPDVLVNMVVMKAKANTIKVWQQLNKSCFTKATTIFTLGKHLSTAISNYTHKPISIIPNWTNTNFVKPMLRSENLFAKKHGLENKLVVMYSGNMGMTHDIESIIYAAELLKNELGIHFVLIGEGAKKTKIEKLVAEKKLTNILLLPYQEKEILPYSLSAADIGIVTLSKGAENISVPSKTYYTLAAGSAIIALASAESELGILINEYNCGKIIDSGQAQEIADYILYLSNNESELNKLKENARAASFNFTPQNAYQYYKQIVSS